MGAEAAAALSPFVSYTPTVYPFAYTIAANESYSIPIDGTADRGAAFGGNEAVWRDRDTNVLTLVDSDFFIIRQVRSREVTTIAGVSGSFGFVNGPRLQARFNVPCGVVRFGSQYIMVDRDNNCLRNISAIGNFSDVGTFSGVCTSFLVADSFSRPTAIDVSTAFVYVADQQNDAIKRVSQTGAATIVASLTDWKPTQIAVVDDTLAFVISSTQQLFRVNLVTGSITDTNFRNASITASLVQPTIDKPSRTLFFVAQHQDAALTQSIVGYAIDEDTFTFYLSYIPGVTDGANPTFRDVKALHSISSYEIIVIQKLSVRGLFVGPRPVGTRTLSPTQTINFRTATLQEKTQTFYATEEPAPTRSFSKTISLTPNDPLLVPIHFLADRFPMDNATALEIIRNLMFTDINDCLGNVSVCRNVSTLVLDDRGLFVSANASMPWNMPFEAYNIIQSCSFTRLRAFLKDEYGGNICLVDVTSSISSRFCGVEAEKARTCDTKCKAATIVSSVVFAAFVGAAITLGVMASGQGILVSALLLLPTGF